MVQKVPSTILVTVPENEYVGQRNGYQIDKGSMYSSPRSFGDFWKCATVVTYDVGFLYR